MYLLKNFYPLKSRAIAEEVKEDRPNQVCAIVPQGTMLASQASLLNLHLWIAQKDVRKKILALLTSLDRKMVLMAHSSTREATISKDVTLCRDCAREGQTELMIWAHERGCEWNEETCKAAGLGLGLGEVPKRILSNF